MLRLRGANFYTSVSMIFIVLLVLGTVCRASGPQYPEFNKKVAITFWSWVPKIEEVVKMFEEAYPTISVEYENVGAGETEYTKLFTVIAAGSGAPDVVQIEFYHLPRFIETGGLLDIGKYGAKEYGPYFVPWTWAQCTRGEEVYAIPQDTGPLAMMYRKDIFDKYGISPPSTWDEFEGAAGKIRQGDGYITNFSTQAGDHHWITGLIWAAGGNFFHKEGNEWYVSIDNPVSRKVCNYWGELGEKDLVKVEPMWGTEWWNGFSTGGLAVWIGAAWSPLLLQNAVADLSGLWRIADLPQWSKETFMSANWGGSTSAVTTQTNHPEASVLFAAWINTNLEALAQDWIGGGLWPATKEGLELSALHEPNPFFGNQDIGAVFAKATEHVNPEFEWSPWQAYFANIWAEEFQKALAGKQSREDALKIIQEKVIAYAKSQFYSIKE